MDKLPILYQDGIRDDTAALRARMDNKPYQLPNGEIVYPPRVPDRRSKDDG